MTEVVDIFTGENVSFEAPENGEALSFMNVWTKAIKDMRAKAVIIIALDDDGAECTGYVVPEHLQAKAAVVLDSVKDEIRDIAMGYSDMDDADECD